MISISLKDAIREIRKAEEQYGERKVHAAIRMALNDGVRKGKTEVRRTIQNLYTIKASRINDPNKEKGLSVRLATNSNLESDLDAGHIPVNLINTKVSFKGTTVAYSFRRNKDGKTVNRKAIKRSKSIVTVEIIKGQSKQINTAFSPGLVRSANGQQFATPAIFARGVQGKPDFKFGKDRYPIAPLSTVSIATAAIALRSQSVYSEPVTQFTINRFMHHIQRLGST